LLDFISQGLRWWLGMGLNPAHSSLGWLRALRTMLLRNCRPLAEVFRRIYALGKLRILYLQDFLG
jgi:hypothetical protein